MVGGGCGGYGDMVGGDMVIWWVVIWWVVGVVDMVIWWVVGVVDMVGGDGRDFHRTSAQSAVAAHHLSFLESCLEDSLVPSGLQLRLKPQIYKEGASDVSTRIASIVTEAQKGILSALVGHYTHVTNEGTIQVSQVETHLTTLVSSLSSSPTSSSSPTLEEHSEALRKTKANLAKRKMELQQRSERKLRTLRNPLDKLTRDFRPKGPRMNAPTAVHRDLWTNPINQKQFLKKIFLSAHSSPLQACTTHHPVQDEDRRSVHLTFFLYLLLLFTHHSFPPSLHTPQLTPITPNPQTTSPLPTPFPKQSSSTTSESPPSPPPLFPPFLPPHVLQQIGNVIASHCNSLPLPPKHTRTRLPRPNRSRKMRRRHRRRRRRTRKPKRRSINTPCTMSLSLSLPTTISPLPPYPHLSPVPISLNPPLLSPLTLPKQTNNDCCTS